MYTTGVYFYNFYNKSVVARRASYVDAESFVCCAPHTLQTPVCDGEYVIDVSLP